MLPDPSNATMYRKWRTVYVTEIRAHCVDGDLIRHCDLHREMQQGMVRLRNHFSPVLSK